MIFIALGNETTTMYVHKIHIAIVWPDCHAAVLRNTERRVDNMPKHVTHIHSAVNTMKTNIVPPK